MENVDEALKMAGAVLLFVLAISIIIFAFGQVRESADTIIDYRDRETSYIDGNYYYEGNGQSRNVGLETIIPSIYRAYLENYKIVFVGLNKPIYKVNGTDKYSLDLENIDGNNLALANDEKKAEFLQGVLYGKYNKSKEDFETQFSISIDGNCEPIYRQLINKTDIIEYLGVYYQNDNPNVPELNKVKKRIITYKVE